MNLSHSYPTPSGDRVLKNPDVVVKTPFGGTWGGVREDGSGDAEDAEGTDELFSASSAPPRDPCSRIRVDKKVGKVVIPYGCSSFKTFGFMKLHIVSGDARTRIFRHI